MALQTWQTLVNAYQFSGTNEGTEFKESTTLTDITPGAAVSGQALTIPAGFLVAGNILRTTCKGWYSTKATPGAIELGLYYGGAAGKALASTGKLKPAFTAAESPFIIETTTRIVTGGEKAKAITHGLVFGLITEGTETAGTSASFFPKTKPQTEVEINLSTANILTVAWKWGESSAEDKLKTQQWLVEVLN